MDTVVSSMENISLKLLIELTYSSYRDCVAKMLESLLLFK